MPTYPPRPRGDVAATKAAIAQLEGYRGGVTKISGELGRLVGDADLSGPFMIGLTAFRVTAAAEVGMAVAAVDGALAQLRAGLQRLERDLASWQAACDRIRSAAP